MVPVALGAGVAKPVPGEGPQPHRVRHRLAELAGGGSVALGHPPTPGLPLVPAPLSLSPSQAADGATTTGPGDTSLCLPVGWGLRCFRSFTLARPYGCPHPQREGDPQPGCSVPKGDGPQAGCSLWGGSQSIPKGDTEQGTPRTPPHLMRPSSRRRSCQSRRSTSAMARRSSSVRKLRSSSASPPSTSSMVGWGHPGGGGQEAGGCSRGCSASRACTSDASIWREPSGPLWGGDHPDPLQGRGAEAQHALPFAPQGFPRTPGTPDPRGGVMLRVPREGAQAGSGTPAASPHWRPRARTSPASRRDPAPRPVFAQGVCSGPALPLPAFPRAPSGATAPRRVAKREGAETGPPSPYTAHHSSLGGGCGRGSCPAARRCLMLPFLAPAWGAEGRKLQQQQQWGRIGPSAPTPAPRRPGTGVGDPPPPWGSDTSDPVLSPTESPVPAPRVSLSQLWAGGSQTSALGTSAQDPAQDPSTLVLDWVPTPHRRTPPSQHQRPPTYTRVFPHHLDFPPAPPPLPPPGDRESP